MEERAMRYLAERGYRIIERNYRCRHGEIDIIARDKKALVFIEVKYRASKLAGDPTESVTPEKARKIVRVARYYLMMNGISEDSAMRFDVLAIDEKGIRHIADAFWS